MRRVLAAVAVVGCAGTKTVPVYVYSSTVEAERETLRAGKPATVAAVDNAPVTLQPTQTVTFYRTYEQAIGTVRLDLALQQCDPPLSELPQPEPDETMTDTELAAISRRRGDSFCSHKDVSYLGVGTKTVDKPREFDGYDALGIALVPTVIGLSLCAGLCKNEALQYGSIAIVSVGVAVGLVYLFRTLAAEDD